jgi:phosphopantothenoylcysteine synthetase/decarboxylase
MKIIYGVTASIAAYRACDIVRELVKRGHDVHVVMTRTAAGWINPVMFGALSENPVVVDDDYRSSLSHDAMQHIELRNDAKLLLVAPASADFIARAAQGRADDVLAATLLAFTGKVALAPAMNPSMYAHPATQNSLKICKSFGYHIFDAADGEAVCGDVGQGKMMSVNEIIKETERLLAL